MRSAFSSPPHKSHLHRSAVGWTRRVAQKVSPRCRNEMQHHATMLRAHTGWRYAQSPAAFMYFASCFTPPVTAMCKLCCFVYGVPQPVQPQQRLDTPFPDTFL